eukprot:2944354-Rhodomonas_salina.1
MRSRIALAPTVLARAPARRAARRAEPGSGNRSECQTPDSVSLAAFKSGSELKLRMEKGL